MQDIIPPNRSFQNRRPAVTSRDALLGRRAAERIVFTRQTRVYTDIKPQRSPRIIEEVIETITEEPLRVTRPIESLSPEAKAEVVSRALANAQRALKAERRKSRDLKRFGIIFIASMFVLITGYVSVDTWITNNRVKAEISGVAQTGDGTPSKEQEGKDEKKPSAQTLGNYAVAASLPRALYIDKLNISSRILPMSVNTDGSIQAPRNIFDAGWYNGSVKPGEVGAAFIDGHASGPTHQGLFAYLDTLVVGDELQVEKGDGTRLTYRVTHTETVPLDEVDMKKVLLPHGNALRALNLMTCTGEWVNDKATYDQRVIVYTEQV